jgi:RNA polymerase sigma-70 factor (ECF subfamily)
MDEERLIDGLAKGDRTAFRELVEQYKKKIFFLAHDMVGNPVDAEDISQEVFIKVFRSFGTFKKDAKLGSWLYRITYNTCIDFLRKKERTPLALGDAIFDVEAKEKSPLLSSASAVDPVQAVETELLQKKIGRALEVVSPQEKAVFLLRHYDDLKLKEIAETLNLSVGSVKSYLFRAIKKLQKELGGQGTVPGLEVSHD